MGYAEDSPCVRMWNPKKERKVLNVGGASFDETVGKSWWLGSQPGVAERMEREPFPDEEGEVADDGEVPVAAGDGPPPPPPPADDGDEGGDDDLHTLIPQDDDDDVLDMHLPKAEFRFFSWFFG